MRAGSNPAAATLVKFFLFGDCLAAKRAPNVVNFVYYALVFYLPVVKRAGFLLESYYILFYDTKNRKRRCDA